MLRASAYWVVRAWYSLFAALAGAGEPLRVHMGLLTWVFSPRSVRATMSRVLLVDPVLLVTQISTRVMLTPERTDGNVFIQAS